MRKISTEASSKSSTESAALFFPITKSNSVPDIYKNLNDSNTMLNNNDEKKNRMIVDNDFNTDSPSSTKNSTNSMMKEASLLLSNQGSIESTNVSSPAGSLEQFDVNANISLSPDDGNDSISDPIRDTPTPNNHQLRFENPAASSFSSSLSSSTTSLSQTQPKLFDTNNTNNSNNSFKFRRHSSQSSLNLGQSNGVPLNLANSNVLGSNERICSSPINNLKMSSRVCQIKIDEGIEPHLNREIKSEREMQSTLKLKSSCDELMLNSDDLALEAFTFDSNRNDTNIVNINSPSSIVAPATSFRRNSQSNMPSPSMSSSCHSCSNSSSPTGNGNNPAHNSGLLRCFSPSTTLISNNNNNSTNGNGTNSISQNYFSQSPSPTRKLFVTRRSMSPVACQLRPSTLNISKRKYSEVDQSDLASICSPKRSNIDAQQQEFAQPLLICTNNSNLSKTLNSARSTSSSPCSLFLNPISPSPNSIASLIIAAPKTLDETNNLKTESNNNINNNSKEEKFVPISKLVWPLTNSNNETNKYTFKPIQLPPPSTSSQSNSFQHHRKQQPHPQQQQQQQTTSLSSNSSVTMSVSNNSPSDFSCDESPFSCSPSVSLISNEKPDSGYQSSIQNNSDSESCT